MGLSTRWFVYREGSNSHASRPSVRDSSAIPPGQPDHRLFGGTALGSAVRLAQCKDFQFGALFTYRPNTSGSN
jgi:hypothetical protein